MKTGMPQIDEVVTQMFDAARERYGADAVARIAASTLPTFETANYTDARQRSTWLHTPGLTARPFWAKAQCGRLTEMISAFEEARGKLIEEIAALDPSRMGVPYDHLSVDPELIRGWKNLFFFKDYEGDAELLVGGGTAQRMLQLLKTATGHELPKHTYPWCVAQCGAKRSAVQT